MIKNSTWKLKKFVDPVCWEPCYEPEGGFYRMKHTPDKDGYCNGCGMAIYEKVLLQTEIKGRQGE